MKTIFFLLLLGLISVHSYSQRSKIELSHYIFPEFTQGTALLKSGHFDTAMFNYNALTEEMIFDSKGKKLALAHLDKIDTIYIDHRKFFLHEGKFLELLYHNKCDLYAAHKCSVLDPGKPAAYGGTSQTSSTTSYSSIVSGGQVYELSLPDGYTTKPYTEYWLKKDGKLSHCLSFKQLSRLFDGKSDQFKKYVKENKLDFEDFGAMADLIRYMEQP